MMTKTLMTYVIAAATLACIHCGAVVDDAEGDPEVEGEQTRDALRIGGGLGAKGDDCTIDRDGLKIPGKENDKNQCCNVFRTDDCVDLPKKTSTVSVGIYSVRR